MTLLVSGGSLVHPVMAAVARGSAGLVMVAVLGAVVGGCGSVAGTLKVDPGAPAAATAPTDVASLPPSLDQPVALAATESPEPGPIAAADLAEPVAAGPVPEAARGDEETPLAAALPLVAQAATGTDATLLDDVDEQYDPWEPFNEKMFDFNYRLDRYVLKPVARAYRTVMPEPFQLLIANGFDNIRWVPRFINNLLQGKFEGAGREMARFVINSTAGVGGLFDPAEDYWGIRPSNEDFGQTLGVWGSGPGPYLVLPLLQPMTVRDGIGLGVDSFLDPLGYVLPFFWDRLGMRVGDTVNERALNYELFQGVEETTIDLYSSVRHFYLKRREQQIKE
jgi:phospholipid-binding lipoprotein MlaA